MDTQHRPPQAAGRSRGESPIEDLIARKSEIDIQQGIAASPSTVFSYLTDPDKFVQWMGANAQLDPRPGGRFRIYVDAEHTASGEYKEVDRPHRLVMTWGWEKSADEPPGSSTVEITLIAQGDGTLLKLRHTNLPSDEQRESHRLGWVLYTGKLQALFR